MIEEAKRLKEKYKKIPMFMIYLFLLVNNEKFMSKFMHIMYISSIVLMMYCIIKSIYNMEGIISWIMLCICIIILFLNGYMIIKDLKDR